MQLRCSRSDDFEICKKTTGMKLLSDFREEAPLTLIFQVMKCESRNDDIEGAECFERVSQIPVLDADSRIRVEPLFCPAQHRR